MYVIAAVYPPGIAEKIERLAALDRAFLERSAAKLRVVVDLAAPKTADSINTDELKNLTTAPTASQQPPLNLKCVSSPVNYGLEHFGTTATTFAAPPQDINQEVLINEFNMYIRNQKSDGCVTLHTSS